MKCDAAHLKRVLNKGKPLAEFALAIDYLNFIYFLSLWFFVAGLVIQCLVPSLLWQP